ncbi:hypothetical protein Y032_0001g338 [Ancylostoma ceylanicum]|uniref:Uncharacterized protein n=1 Tax=Ancylostoma ceylanicum TaxID=53326 RepID=A0A016W346_9BILA|nr:hypothetical protein Y032_0001g338 [Ancylostoma ceylanicum]
MKAHTSITRASGLYATIRLTISLLPDRNVETGDIHLGNDVTFGNSKQHRIEKSMFKFCRIPQPSSFFPQEWS